MKIQMFCYDDEAFPKVSQVVHIKNFLKTFTYNDLWQLANHGIEIVDSQ